MADDDCKQTIEIRDANNALCIFDCCKRESYYPQHTLHEADLFLQLRAEDGTIATLTGSIVWESK